MQQQRLQYGRGFSLVELLVVVLIIGLTVSVVALQVGDNREYKLRLAVKQLSNNLKLVLEESVLSNRQWGLDFYQQMGENGRAVYGYRWLSKQEQGWQGDTFSELESEYQFPATVELALEIEGEPQLIGDISEQPPNNTDTDQQLVPDIWLLSSGEVTPFLLTLSDREQPDTQKIVRADQLGRIQLEGFAND